jgi:nitrite reductase/ring-hydroxylating ferredoxin subunit
MAGDDRVICASEALVDGGPGVRFELDPAVSFTTAGFVVRHCGAVHAFVNRCPHSGTELDWNPGEFFDETQLYLMCATHGALFVPGNGYCVAGPCRGASLEPLAVAEHDGKVILLASAPARRTASR